MIIQRISPTIPVQFPDETVDTFFRVTGCPELLVEAHRFVAAAAKEAESYSDIALLTQTIRMTVCPAGMPRLLSLPINPLVEAESVVVTMDGTSFTDFSTYVGAAAKLRFPICLPYKEAVIEYNAGFGADASSIPDPLRHAILDQALTMFEMRGAASLSKSRQSNNGMSHQAARIFARYRSVKF